MPTSRDGAIEHSKGFAAFVAAHIDETDVTKYLDHVRRGRMEAVIASFKGMFGMPTDIGACVDVVLAVVDHFRSDDVAALGRFVREAERFPSGGLASVSDEDLGWRLLAFANKKLVPNAAEAADQDGAQ
jgi:hypothetical protein